VVWVQCELDSGTIQRLLPGMRGMFRVVRQWVLEPLEGSFDVSWHGQVHGAVSVVPGEC